MVVLPNSLSDVQRRFHCLVEYSLGSLVELKYKDGEMLHCRTATDTENTFKQ